MGGKSRGAGDSERREELAETERLQVWLEVFRVKGERVPPLRGGDEVESFPASLLTSPRFEKHGLSLLFGMTCSPGFLPSQTALVTSLQACLLQNHVLSRFLNVWS